MANPRMTAEIGRVLGGRYRLIAPIGMGASAQVYLADDVKLRRRVALKMLHDALAGDSEFLRRFRAEARAAAALSHPNIMAVYDWSDGTEHGDVAFIVTEFLPGGSLRSLLDSGFRLSPAQALGVGLEAARALDYAHRRGFVHRDIKPANLLFGEEQRLRIADFGLARALAEAAWTEPQGAVLGTARYASPEQAKGERLSGKADVYALALVLVEAVTGEVPFVADTTLGTLMARVDRQLEVPDSLGPLKSVITEAGHPDPEQRIDAGTFARGLLRAAKELSRPAPLPLVGALAAGAVMADDLDPTVHANAPIEGQPTDLTSEDLDLEPPPWVNQADQPEPFNMVGAAGAAGVIAAIDPDATGAIALEDLPGEDRPVEGLAGDGLSGPDASGHDASGHDASGNGTQDGTSPAEAAGATALINNDSRPDVGADTNSDQPGWSPGQGERTVNVALVDEDAALIEAGDARSAYDTNVATGEVAQTVVSPDGSGLGGHGSSSAAFTGSGADDATADGDKPRGRRRWPWILLVVVLLGAAAGGAFAVATRPSKVDAPPIDLPVPQLVGRTETQARAIADAAGWRVTTVGERRDGTKKGEVLEARPGAGQRLATGRTLTLTVSQGQTIVDVPGDLAGKSLEDASAALDSVGLELEVTEERFSEDVAKDVVIDLAQSTPGRLERGSTVAVVVSKGPEPRIVPVGLAGGSEDEAVAALEALGLKAAIVRSYNDDIEEGQVISILPKAGSTVERGASINVEVSRGPNLVAVPSIRSADTIQEAISILGSANLRAGDVSGSASGSPQGTSPGAGTMVRPGTAVDIILG
ncbi:MAG: PASTA domain-containing protein [Acidimicrobiales bacterium]|nr:PASTA domain-containing protein [Acidimicrobiales bacterium]